MNSTSDKLRLRAEIISILNKYRTLKKISDAQFDKDIEALNNIKDKDFLAKIVFKEIIQASQDYIDIYSGIAIDTIPPEVFKKHSLKILEDKGIQDTKKFYFISLLEHKGIKIDYDNLDVYIKNPAKVANDGIKEFLASTLDSPESRIDLIDFYSNITNEERIYLLDNLILEYSGDILANTLYNIVISGACIDDIDFIIENLYKIDSYYTFKAFEYINKHYTINSSNKLKVSTFLKTNRRKYYLKADKNIIKNSIPYICYLSFVDGQSNFTLIFTRKYEDDSLSTFFATCNLTKGITSCIGFHNIQEDYFNKIVKRLFCDSLPIKIDYYTAKGIIEYFSKINIDKNIAPPYEFQIWNILTGDIKFKEKDLFEYLTRNLSLTKLNSIKFGKISKSKLIENWYYKRGENKQFDKAIESVDKKHLLDMDEIDKKITLSAKKILKEDKDFTDEIKNRLVLQSYVTNLGGFTVSSSVLFSISKNEKYLNDIVKYFMYKSMYVYFRELLEINENLFLEEIKTSYTPLELVKLIKEIENKFK